MSQAQITGNQSALRQHDMDYGSYPPQVVGTMKRIEQKTGVDMKGITVRFNSTVPAQFQARALAQGGNRVEIGPGNGDCVNHELGHIVQQRLGKVKPTGTMNHAAVNDDKTLERQATTIGNG